MSGFCFTFWQVLFLYFIFDFFNRGRALCFACSLLPTSKFIIEFGFEFLIQRIYSGRFGKFFCGKTHCFSQIVNQINDDFDLLMSKHDAFVNLVFRNFLGKTFDHGDGVFRASHDQIQIAFQNLSIGRENNKFTSNLGDANRAGGL